ncbi:MAG: hypothetical protein ABR968_00115 [Bacteroidales bacterium]
MKYFFVLAVSTFILSSCTYIKDMQVVCRNKNGITAINTSGVPALVLQSFKDTYPSVSNEKWFELNSHTFASIQKKEMHLFDSDGKKFQDVKTDTIPYGVLKLFTAKYPGILYRRCYKIARYSFAVLFDKDNSPNLIFYHYRSTGIDEEHDYGDSPDVNMDNQDLWWDNDKVDEK